MTDWINICAVGDCRDILKAMVTDGVRVQMCVTSPPYWGLRDYGVEGQLGLEATPEEYIANMVEVFRLVREVLADEGTLWVNMGGGFKGKQLDGMPWRLAFALQADGWYLRSDIIWAKPNPMPESVTDRPTKSHEYLFLLSKNPRYYYDADAVREQEKNPGESAKEIARQLARRNGLRKPELVNDCSGAWGGDGNTYKGGRNLRDVWTIAAQPYPEAHFATFPQKLVEPCIMAGTSERGHCPVCRKRWDRVVEAKASTETRSNWAGHGASKNGASRIGGFYDSEHKTTGWQAGCLCAQTPVPDIVLDPFMGAGTVAAVAQRLGRNWIGAELNPSYIAMHHKRTAQQAMAL